MAHKKPTFKQDYQPTQSELTAMSRCNDHRITIYPVPVSNFVCNLTIMRADGFKQVGKETFDLLGGEWSKKLFELYLILETRL